MHTTPGEAAPASVARSAARGGLWPYAQIARIDHWFKNSFMALGVVLAFFYEPELAGWQSVWPLLLGLVANCLVASSNYVLNEWLDGPLDRLHAVKRNRPVQSGATKPALAYRWLLLAAPALSLAWSLNWPSWLGPVAVGHGDSQHSHRSARRNGRRRRPLSRSALSVFSVVRRDACRRCRSRSRG